MHSWRRGRAGLRAWPCRPCASWDRKSGALWRSSFCASFLPLTEADGKQFSRVQRLIDATAGLDEIAYRAEVRLAALLRMRTLLLDVAGRYYLQTQGTAWPNRK